MDGTVQVLINISVCALAGLLMSRVCKLLKLPAVTGYLIAGILVGCFCLGRFALPGGLYLGFSELDHGLGIICDIALGFIAAAIWQAVCISLFVGVRKSDNKILFVYDFRCEDNYFSLCRR